MKLGTPNHIKAKRLKRLLARPLHVIVGILEMTWQLAGECADEGEIGKFSNEEIADYCDWDGDPDELIDALVQAGWLDENSNHRLVVHDWLDHCPGFIRERVRKRRACAAKCNKRTYDEKTRDTNGTAADAAGTDSDDAGTRAGPAAACPVYTYPNPTQPSPSQPIQEKAHEVPPPTLAGAGSFDTLVSGWNNLAWVSRVQDRHGAEITKAWNNGWRKPEVREWMEKPDAVLDMIGASRSFLEGQPWFRFAWLLKREQNGTENNMTKLMAGQYRDDQRKQANRARIGGGQVYQEKPDSRDETHGRL